MPNFNEANIRHLLRRTEFVDRSQRVAELLPLGSIEAAVDNVMAIDTKPPAYSFPPGSENDDQLRIAEFSEWWLEQMTSAPRPFGERMAFFWHGHLVSDQAKSYGTQYLREQIDFFRTDGLGDLGRLMKAISVQTAMLRYLDNAENFAESPNQNFARELMELFLLGVGNYTEDDVVAGTAAWTGHTVDRNGGTRDGIPYFDAARHLTETQQLLGQTITSDDGQGGRTAGDQMIDIILGSGLIPKDAVIPDNAGRPSREVAAEFLSFKLWQEFGEAGSGGVPSGVAAAMKSALLDTNLDIRSWVRAMLVHDDFYAESTKVGLVRQPVVYSIACTVASGIPSRDIGGLFLMKRAGQLLFNCPDVSGWGVNRYWVNASAMGARNRIAIGCLYKHVQGFYGPNRYTDLPGGRLTFDEVILQPITPESFVDRLIQLMDLKPPPKTRAEIVAFCTDAERGYWINAIELLLLAPEMHIA